MYGAGPQMHQRPRQCRRRVLADAEIDLSLVDEEGFVPWMAVRRRAAALGTLLQEDLVAFGRVARREHGHVLADDVERRGVVPWSHHERLGAHLDSPSHRGSTRIRRD